MVTLGFVGLGNMGGPMATHLVEAGYDVVAFDLEEAAVDALAAVGARPADSVGAVGDAADVVFLSLPGPDAVEAVVAELEPTLSAGSVVVDTSTSSPETTRRLADRLADDDVRLLGAPVSGGTSGAEDGSLAIMVGGDRTTFETCEEYFEAFTANVFFIGDDPGHGHAVKLLNNFLSFTAMLATSEAVVLGREVGLDVETMCDVFNVSTGRNTATEYKFPDVVATGGELGFSMDNVEKDIRLLTQFGEDHDVPLLFASVVRNQVGYAQHRLGDDADMIDLYDYLRDSMVGDAND
jgi:3-hydroxyisobutyrate dehydrogenase